MEKTTDVSYGVIPIRQVGDTWEVFLIHQFSNIGNNSYWVFPKGHPEAGETPEQTAKRELIEETGMTVGTLLNEPTFSLQYSFTFDEVLINKTVTFFIGVVKDGRVKLQDDEVKEAGWYSLVDAMTRLDYSDTKKMFTEVQQFLATYKAPR